MYLPHQQRVVDEQKEVQAVYTEALELHASLASAIEAIKQHKPKLLERHESLTKFIELSPVYKTLNEAEQDRLSKQAEVMSKLYEDLRLVLDSDFFETVDRVRLALCRYDMLLGNRIQCFEVDSDTSKNEAD